MHILSYEQEVEFLYSVISRWWVNRALHQMKDKADIESFRIRLQRRCSGVLNIWQYAVALREELWALGDGHLRLGTTFCRAESLWASGLQFCAVSEGVAISGVSIPNLEKLPICPEAGDLLVEIDGQPTENYLQTVRLQPGSTPAHRRWNAIISLSFQERFPNEKPSPSTVTIQKRDSRCFSMPLTWRTVDKDIPTPDCIESKIIEKNIGYINIRTLCCRDHLGQVSDAEFRRQAISAMQTLADAKYVIVDLRRNSGGRDQQGQIAASIFSDDPIEWFCYKHPSPFFISDQIGSKMVYTSPAIWSLPHSLSPRQIWFLIGPGCFSTASLLAFALRKKSLSRFVGESLTGGAGNPLEFRLPYSGLSVNVPISSFFMSDNNDYPLEAASIEPNIPALQTTDDLRKGSDTVLKHAISAIKASISQDEPSLNFNGLSRI